MQKPVFSVELDLDALQAVGADVAEGMQAVLGLVLTTPNFATRTVTIDDVKVGVCGFAPQAALRGG